MPVGFYPYVADRQHNGGKVCILTSLPAANIILSTFSRILSLEDSWALRKNDAVLGRPVGIAAPRHARCPGQLYPVAGQRSGNHGHNDGLSRANKSPLCHHSSL